MIEAQQARLQRDIMKGDLVAYVASGDDAVTVAVGTSAMGISLCITWRPLPASKFFPVARKTATRSVASKALRTIVHGIHRTPAVKVRPVRVPRAVESRPAEPAEDAVDRAPLYRCSRNGSRNRPEGRARRRSRSQVSSTTRLARRALVKTVAAGALGWLLEELSDGYLLRGPRRR